MTGHDTVVVGVGRSGVSTLIEALSVVAPTLPVASCTHDDLVPSVRARVGLLVIDPSSVVGHEERILFDRLREVSGTVAVVCTKVDAFWDWPTNARASRAVLDPQGRSPVFAVSGAAAVAGAVDESGVDDLAEWIRQAPDVAARGTAVRPAPTGEATPDARRRRSAVDLAATRTRLLRMRDRGRADRLAALRSGLGSARARAVADLNAGVRDITATSRDTVAGLRAADVDAHAAWVGKAVTHLRDRVDTRVRADLDQIRAVALLGVEPVAPPTAPPRRSPVELRPAAVRRRGAEDVSLIVLGASAGVGLGRLVVTPLEQVETLQWIAMPLALVVFAAVTTWLVRLRRLAALRASVRTWTAEALGEARATVEHDLLARITAAEPVIAGQVMRHHERRARSIADDVAAIDRDLRALGRGGAGAPDGTASASPTSDHGRGATRAVSDGSGP